VRFLPVAHPRAPADRPAGGAAQDYPRVRHGGDQRQVRALSVGGGRDGRCLCVLPHL
jgi:hypothetical protein